VSIPALREIVAQALVRSDYPDLSGLLPFKADYRRTDAVLEAIADALETHYSYLIPPVEMDNGTVDRVIDYIRGEI
jgi:hypothetical protein